MDLKTILGTSVSCKVFCFISPCWALPKKSQVCSETPLPNARHRSVRNRRGCTAGRAPGAWCPQVHGASKLIPTVPAHTSVKYRFLKGIYTYILMYMYTHIKQTYIHTNMCIHPLPTCMNKSVRLYIYICLCTHAHTHT